MPKLHLPTNPDLDHLKGQARTLQRRVREGDAEALAAVAEHHPRAGEVPAGTEFRLVDAQLVLARLYGFATWPKLRDHIGVVVRHARSPHQRPTGGANSDPVDDFVALSCLVYGGDDPRRREEARAMVAARPEMATATLAAMAVTGAVEAARVLLDHDPSAANTDTGPFAWPPLLYVAYGRLDLDGLDLGFEPDPLGFARLLLDRGADPDAGYLWEGLTSPFTALTGAFGQGEDGHNQPPHPQGEALARMLLDAGADPNDYQTLYNRHFRPDNSHLELLLEYGLGKPKGGTWAKRLGPTLPSPSQMVEDQLTWAAANNFPDRVRLLLDHGVDPDGIGTAHPVVGRQTAYEIALRSGANEVAELLRAAGAAPVELEPWEIFVAAALGADEATVERLRADDPEVVATAIERAPAAVMKATELGRPDAVRLLVRLDFDIDALRRTTALHSAVASGHLPLVQLLIELGADPNIRDQAFDALPLDWARHGRHDAIIAYLEPLTDESTVSRGEGDHGAG